MRFENPSKFTLEKMQELVGKKVYRNLRESEEVSVITQVDYYTDYSFGIITGYKLTIEDLKKTHRPYNMSIQYPDYFDEKFFNYSHRDFPDEFVKDIKCHTTQEVA